MARQVGTFKIKGTIGDLTFYKQDGEHLVRSKGGVDAERIKNDPAFQRTRENGNEFGEAGRQGKFLRIAFRNVLDKAADKRLTSRLTAKLMEIVKSDAVNGRGERKVASGDLSLLKGFEFNNRSNLSSTLFATMLATVDRAVECGWIVCGQAWKSTRSPSEVAGDRVHGGPDKGSVWTLQARAEGLGLGNGISVGERAGIPFIPNLMEGGCKGHRQFHWGNCHEEEGTGWPGHESK